MRLNTTLNKYRFVGLLVASLLLITDLQAQEETRDESKLLDITITVKDAEGNALPETSVTVGEGFTVKETNEKGESSFRAMDDDIVTIEHAGFEKKVARAGELITDPVIVLTRLELFMTSDDAVPLPLDRKSVV